MQLAGRIFFYRLWAITRSLSSIAEATARYFVIASGLSMLIAVVLQVVFRYVIRGPLPWSEEFSRYLLIWFGFVGGSIAFRWGEFMGIEVLMVRLPLKPKKILPMIVSIIVILFLCYILAFGIDFASKANFQRSPVLRIEMTYPYLAIPVGAAFCLVHALFLLMEQLRIVLGIVFKNEKPSEDSV